MMKKYIISLVILALSGISSFAQDLICTQDNQHILCYVNSFTDEAVLYNKADSNDSSVYIIAKSKLSKIIYEDGRELILNPSERKIELSYENGGIYLGHRKLNYAQMYEVMPYDLYSQVKDGMRMRKIGRGLIIPGAVLTGASAACGIVTFVLALSLVESDYIYAGQILYATGTLIVIGVPMLSAGVASYSVGQGRVRRAVNAYNRDYDRNYSFNISKTRNGVGLTLNF